MHQSVLCILRNRRGAGPRIPIVPGGRLLSPLIGGGKGDGVVWGLAFLGYSPLDRHRHVVSVAPTNTHLPNRR
jgi:hypothetical protein